MKKIQTTKRVEDKLTPKVMLSPLLIIAEVFFVIGAIFALVSLFRLADSSHRYDIIYSIASQEVSDFEAIMTWFTLVVIVKILFAVFSLAFAIGFVTATVSAANCKGNPCRVKGLGFLSLINNVAIWMWVGLLGIGTVVFVYKIVTYTVAIIAQTEDFIFPLAAVVVGELVMVLIIIGITALLIIGWKSLADLFTHLRYMLYTERLDGHIAPISYVIFFVLTAASVYLVGFFSYDAITMVSFGSLAVATLLTGIWTRIVKSRVEWMHFIDYEKEKNT